MQVPDNDHIRIFLKWETFFSVFAELVEDRWQTSKIKKTTLLRCSLFPDGAQSFVFLLKNCDGVY